MADPARPSPDSEAVQRLVDSAVAQGHPRTIDDPAILRKVATLMSHPRPISRDPKADRG